MNECTVFPVNLKFSLDIIRASLVAQRLKRLPAMRETWVQFLGREDPLEKDMATHSSILVCRIPWMEESGGLQFMESQRVGHNGEMIIFINRKGSRDFQQKSSR